MPKVETYRSSSMERVRRVSLEAAAARLAEAARRLDQALVVESTHEAHVFVRNTDTGERFRFVYEHVDAGVRFSDPRVVVVESEAKAARARRADLCGTLVEAIKSGDAGAVDYVSDQIAGCVRSESREMGGDGRGRNLRDVVGESLAKASPLLTALVVRAAAGRRVGGGIPAPLLVGEGVMVDLRSSSPASHDSGDIETIRRYRVASARRAGKRLHENAQFRQLALASLRNPDYADPYRMMCEAFGAQFLTLTDAERIEVLGRVDPDVSAATKRAVVRNLGRIAEKFHGDEIRALREVVGGDHYAAAVERMEEALDLTTMGQVDVGELRDAMRATLEQAEGGRFMSGHLAAKFRQAIRALTEMASRGKVDAGQVCVAVNLLSQFAPFTYWPGGDIANAVGNAVDDFLRVNTASEGVAEDTVADDLLKDFNLDAQIKRAEEYAQGARIAVVFPKGGNARQAIYARDAQAALDMMRSATFAAEKGWKLLRLGAKGEFTQGTLGEDAPHGPGENDAFPTGVTPDKGGSITGQPRAWEGDGQPPQAAGDFKADKDAPKPDERGGGGKNHPPAKGGEGEPMKDNFFDKQTPPEDAGAAAGDLGDKARKGTGVNAPPNEGLDEDSSGSEPNAEGLARFLSGPLGKAAKFIHLSDASGKSIQITGGKVTKSDASGIRSGESASDIQASKLASEMKFPVSFRANMREDREMGMTEDTVDQVLAWIKGHEDEIKRSNDAIFLLKPHTKSQLKTNDDWGGIIVKTVLPTVSSVKDTLVRDMKKAGGRGFWVGVGKTPKAAADNIKFKVESVDGRTWSLVECARCGCALRECACDDNVEEALTPGDVERLSPDVQRKYRETEALIIELNALQERLKAVQTKIDTDAIPYWRQMLGGLGDISEQWVGFESGMKVYVKHTKSVPSGTGYSPEQLLLMALGMMNEATRKCWDAYVKEAFAKVDVFTTQIGKATSGELALIRGEGIDEGLRDLWNGFVSTLKGAWGRISSALSNFRSQARSARSKLDDAIKAAQITQRGLREGGDEEPEKADEADGDWDQIHGHMGRLSAEVKRRKQEPDPKEPEAAKRRKDEDDGLESECRKCLAAARKCLKKGGFTEKDLRDTDEFEDEVESYAEKRRNA